MKKWQDTILTLEQIDKAIQEGYRWNNLKDKSLLGVQAQVTWEIAYKAGIDKMINIYKQENPDLYKKFETWWEAKRKEWGIK